MRLPSPRGPLTEYLTAQLVRPPRDLRAAPPGEDDPLAGEDVPLAMAILYELHYRGWEEVDDRWEWQPSLLALRARLEDAMEASLRAAVTVPAATDDIAAQLMSLVGADDGPSLSRRLARTGTLEEYREFLIHRSIYHLKEADPHTWAIPRLRGSAKAALVEIQSDEYGGGRADWMHATLFGRAMRALDLDDTYGAYVDVVPGTTLALVNLMSLFGLHRRRRGAIVGHLAVLEMTSSEPMRRYAAGLRRLGLGDDAVRFFDEHVEADALHEQIAAHDLAGGLVAQEPDAAADVLAGAASVLTLEARFAELQIRAWDLGRSSLRTPAMSGAGVG
jgi:hypothetical protein